MALLQFHSLFISIYFCSIHCWYMSHRKMNQCNRSLKNNTNVIKKIKIKITQMSLYTSNWCQSALNLKFAFDNCDSNPKLNLYFILLSKTLRYFFLSFFVSPFYSLKYNVIYINIKYTHIILIVLQLIMHVCKHELQVSWY